LTIDYVSYCVASSMSNTRQNNLEFFKEIPMNMLGTLLMGRRSSVGRAEDS